MKEEEGHAIISYDEAPPADDPYDSDDLNTSFGDDIDDILCKPFFAALNKMIEMIMKDEYEIN